MPTIKVRDLPRPCTSDDHEPPSMMVYDPGVYEHTCSACGRKVVFTVNGTWCNQGMLTPRSDYNLGWYSSYDHSWWAK